MKKINFMFTAVIITAGFTACNNSETVMAEQDAQNLVQYVDSVESAPKLYTEANWREIDNGYQEWVSKADQSADKLSSEEKANAEISKAKYATIKAEYEANLKEKEAAAKIAAAADYRIVLRNSLFGEGKIGTDMTFGFANAGNILDVYKRFVNTVDDNKKKYTREDWDEIKVLYEALDTRKNIVEKEGIKSADNLDIAKQKIRYSAIKSAQRGVSKIAENTEAKQE